MIKTLLQKLIRFINISLFTNTLPLKVSIYFHETYKNDIEDIERIILFFKKEGYELVINTLLLLLMMDLQIG